MDLLTSLFLQSREVVLQSPTLILSESDLHVCHLDVGPYLFVLLLSECQLFSEYLSFASNSRYMSPLQDALIVKTMIFAVVLHFSFIAFIFASISLCMSSCPLL